MSVFVDLDSLVHKYKKNELVLTIYIAILTSCLFNNHIYDLYHVCIKLAQFAKLHFWHMVASETVVKVIMSYFFTITLINPLKGS